MAYKYSKGKTFQGDIYNEDDQERNTYIDFGDDDYIGLVASGSSVLVVSASAVGINAQPDSTFALDIPVSASTVRMGRLELGAWPNSTGYGFVGHSYQDHHGASKYLNYNILIGSSGDLSLNSLGGQDMYFRIGTAIKAAIDSNGNFAIGDNAAHASTWTPSSLLHLSSSDDQMIFLCHDEQTNPVLAVTGSGRVGIGTATPASTFEVSGSQAGNYTQTATSITVNETHYVVDYTGAGNATFTLPATSGVTGRQYHILSHAQSVEDQLTVTGSGGAFQGAHLEGDATSVTIDGNTPQSITVVSTGTNWFILHDGRTQG